MSAKDGTHKVLPLKNLRSDKVKYYLVFCKYEDNFIEFISKNSYIAGKYKFVMLNTHKSDGTFTGIQTPTEVRMNFGLFRTKIAFLDCFEDQAYIDEMEFAHCMANGTPIPERLIPSTIKNMMNDE